MKTLLLMAGVLTAAPLAGQQAPLRSGRRCCPPRFEAGDQPIFVFANGLRTR